MFSTPKTIYLNQDFLQISKSYFEDGFFTAEVLVRKLNDNVGTSLGMFEIEISLKVLPVVCFSILFLILFLILPKYNLLKKTEFIIRFLTGDRLKKTKIRGSISLILVFYLLYALILTSILTNNIQSSQVVVDTSDIISNSEDLLKTKR